MKIFLSKLKESTFSVLPIMILVAILGLTIAPISGTDFINLGIATILLIFGMCFFSIGADNSLLDMGSFVGGSLSKSRKIWLFLLLSLVLGFIITIAEPDLSILATQIVAINKWLFICVVALGVGIFLSLAVLRIIFQIKISTMIFIAYGIAIILMFFVPSSLLPVSIDSGSVTTGAISVPFLLSFGLGISAVRGNNNTENDSFGLIALSSIGPIITTQIMSLLVNSSDLPSPTVIISPNNGTFLELLSNIGSNLAENLLEIALVLLPIIIFFFAYNFICLHLPKSKIIKILIGLAYTYLGIVIFLTGTISALLPIGSVIGFEIASKGYNWILIPLSAIIGFLMILAEPAVHVLNKQVEEITNGVISKKVMMIAICLGVSFSLVLCILRVMLNINFLYIIAPLFIICILLGLFAPKMFVAIAFDSGGVSVGAMAGSLILPFISGICVALNVNTLHGAFGTLAIIACLPILVILCIGSAFKIITNYKKSKLKPVKSKAVEIIEFEIGDIK